MDRLELLEVFAKVVESGSLSAAARALDRSVPGVSRQIAALEKQLGVRLLSRTTRRMSTTEGGRAFYERVKHVLGDLHEAELQVSRHQAVPTGRLVVSAPVSFGPRFIAPQVARFMAQYPEVSVSLHITDRYVDLVGESVDVAIRVGALADSGLIARRLGQFHRIVCASPEYLRRWGVPKHPRDLTRHQCLLFTYLAEGDDWRLHDKSRAYDVRVQGRFRSDNQDAVLEAAIHGLGLMLAPSGMVERHVQDGRLQQVLPAYQVAPVPIQAVFPNSRLLSAITRTFLDFLADPGAAEDFDHPASATQKSRAAVGRQTRGPARNSRTTKADSR